MKLRIRSRRGSQTVAIGRLPEVHPDVLAVQPLVPAQGSRAEALMGTLENSLNEEVRWGGVT